MCIEQQTLNKSAACLHRGDCHASEQIPGVLYDCWQVAGTYCCKDCWLTEGLLKKDYWRPSKVLLVHATSYPRTLRAHL